MPKLALFFLVISVNALAFDPSGLEISLAADMVHSQGLNNESKADDKMTMRGAEMMFYAPVDHNFDGTLSAAAHDENGETLFELHEMYLSTTKITPGLRLKAGKFFLGIGRLNQVHQHDWPFIRAPKVHETFFDSEGVYDSGLEVDYLLPTETYLDLTLGVTSGHTYGHSHSKGEKPKVSTHYFRLSSFNNFSTTEGIEYGLNYLGRTDAHNSKMSLSGLDITMKHREGKVVTYLLQSEIWHRSTIKDSNIESREAGLYVLNQFGVGIRSKLGLRLDMYKDLTKENAITKKRINNISYGIAPEFTWKSSEFVTLRSGLSHSFTKEEGETLEKDTRLEMQIVFILGAHPAHSF